MLPRYCELYVIIFNHFFCRISSVHPKKNMCFGSWVISNKVVKVLVSPFSYPVDKISFPFTFVPHLSSRSWLTLSHFDTLSGPSLCGSLPFEIRLTCPSYLTFPIQVNSIFLVDKQYS